MVKGFGIDYWAVRNFVDFVYSLCGLPFFSLALNFETNEHVVIKKIVNAFDNKINARQTLREIKLLRNMDHENVVAIRDIIPPPQRGAFNDVYIAYELMDTDLHQIIRSNQALSEEHCQVRHAD
ncbi:hypothetical protein SLE2022_315650 [Rubroshorea leprosula]